TPESARDQSVSGESGCVNVAAIPLGRLASDSDERTEAMTEWPSAISRRQSALPTKPFAPVTRMRGIYWHSIVPSGALMEAIRLITSGCEFERACRDVSGGGGKRREHFNGMPSFVPGKE